MVIGTLVLRYSDSVIWKLIQESVTFTRAPGDWDAGDPPAMSWKSHLGGPFPYLSLGGKTGTAIIDHSLSTVLEAVGCK